MSDKFDQKAARKPGPFLAVDTDAVVYEEAPIMYLFAGAISADRDVQATKDVRAWYLKRIAEHVESLAR